MNELSYDIDIRVRQKRVHVLDSESHKAFSSYMSESGYSDDERAYILNVGKGCIQSVNDTYSKLTFPFNKSQDGYGVTIIPSKQVMMSDCHNYEGDVMYDIDIGSKRGRLKVKYKDKDGSMREDMMQTSYIERYMNFASSAYNSGLRMTSSYKSICSKSKCEEIDQNIVQCVAFGAHSHLSRNEISSLRKEWSDCYDESKNTFDFESFKKNKLPSYNFFSIDDINTDAWFVNNLTSSNKDLYLRSFMEGVNDNCKRNVMKMCYACFMPEKGTIAYKQIEKSVPKRDFEDIKRNTMLISGYDKIEAMDDFSYVDISSDFSNGDCDFIF